MNVSCPESHYLFWPSKQLIFDPERIISSYNLDPSRVQNRNFLEFRAINRKIKLVTKTKFEGVLSTKDFYVSDYSQVNKIIDSLVQSIPEKDRDLFIFRRYENTLFLLDPQSFLNTQRIPVIIPFVLVVNQQCEKILYSGLKDITENSAEGNSFFAGEAHHFHEVFFDKPTWCQYCKKFIWGIVSKQGYRCSVCGFSCHRKCLLKIGNNCYKGGIPKRSLNRQGTNGLLTNSLFSAEKNTTEQGLLLLGIQIPSMEGYLLVKMSKKWKARYFRIEEDKFICFKSHENMEPLKIYTVYQIIDVDAPVKSSEKKIFHMKYFDSEIKEESFKPSDELDKTLRLWIYNLKEWVALAGFFYKQFELSRTSFFSFLPHDIILYILSMCEKKRVALTCKSWYILLKDHESTLAQFPLRSVSSNECKLIG